MNPLLGTHTKVAADVARVGAGAFSAVGLATGWDQLSEAWRSMPVDAYLPGAETYRQRRYGRVEATHDGREWALRPLDHEPFCQTEEIVPLYGGRPRQFPPIPDLVIESCPLQRLLGFDLELVSQLERGQPRYVVGLHMVRVVASATSEVPPAPEGRHRDGHRFVVMHLISREQCLGGTSRVFAGDEVVLETTMERFLDSVIVDDARVEHEVDPIRAIGALGWRDTLLVDFDHPSKET